MDNKLHILCTAPVDELLIQTAATRGIDIDVVSFIQTEPIVNEQLSLTIEGLYKQNICAVFTSANAVAALPQSKEVTWQVYCIGNATQKAVTEKFENATIAGTASSAAELAKVILKNTDIKELVFFCGDKRRDELPTLLRTANVSVAEIIVYKTVETPKKLENNYNGILFFSPSAVQSFFSANTVKADTTLFAIGRTTAHTIHEACNNEVIVSEQPDKQYMIDKVLSYYIPSNTITTDK